MLKPFNFWLPLAPPDVCYRKIIIQYARKEEIYRVTTASQWFRSLVTDKVLKILMMELDKNEIPLQTLVILTGGDY